MVLAHQVQGVVRQDPPQPGQQLAPRGPLKAAEVPMRFEQRLLHQVRGIDLGPQPALHLHAGHAPQVIATGGEELLSARAVSLPRQAHELVQCRRIFAAH